MFTPGPPALTPVGTPDTLSETGSLKSGRSRRNAIPPNLELTAMKIISYTDYFKYLSYKSSSYNIHKSLMGLVSSVGRCPFCLLRSQPPYLHRNIGSGLGFYLINDFFGTLTFCSFGPKIFYFPFAIRPFCKSEDPILDKVLNINSQNIFSSSRKNFANFRQSSLDGMTNRSLGTGLSRARPSNRY